MSAQIPPDLRLLCRKLSSTEPAQLPRSLPSLSDHVSRCSVPLSTPQDPTKKGDAAEAALLVHKLKASLTTLVDSRVREARFASIALIKAAVDVGGWEVLKDCGPWVKGLLSIVQKGDPAASKELAIVALTRIYTLLCPHQTLAREVATPTIPAFATACLQLIKPSGANQVADTPSSVVETVCGAFTTLIPLYPATFRPSSSQTMAALRLYVAPTESDNNVIPSSLSNAARRLAATQHFMAAKSGGSDEWAKLVTGIIDELHATISQVFRAIEESWEPTAGIAQTQVDMDQPYPAGGSESQELPPWEGVQAGSQRIAGLFGYLSACLQNTSKGAVALPLTKITDVISRICLVARLSPKTQSWDHALRIRARIGREEKDELWSVIPDIHIAALQLMQQLYRRLGEDVISYTTEELDHLTRVTNSGMSLSAVRATSYSTLNDVLLKAGPTMTKSMVDSLGAIIGSTCRDLQEDAGYLKVPKKAQSTTANSKKNGSATNTELFLKSSESAAETRPLPLEKEHKKAALALLVTVLSHVPQQHLKGSHRALLDQVAVLTRHRDAMVASVLNPYTDSRGRTYASLLPQLTAVCPEDSTLEILRTNLRPERGQVNGDEEQPSDEEEDEEDEDEDEEMAEREHNVLDTVHEEEQEALKPGIIPAAPKMDLPIQTNPFEARSNDATVYGASDDLKEAHMSPPKRKYDMVEDVPQKRQEMEPPAAAAEDDSDSEESVHLNMELDLDSDDGEEA